MDLVEKSWRQTKLNRILTPVPLPNEIADIAALFHLRHGMPKANNCEAVPSMQTS